jgi:predicted dehydrogenase
MDLGVHCAELIEYILGEKISEVKCICSTKAFNYEVEDGAIVVFKTNTGTLGHIDVNFNIPDNASESKLEIYGTDGYIICSGTLAQLERGQMKYLYSPQGEYSAMQNREVGVPVFYEGEGGDLYQKQIAIFSNILRSGKCDYTFAEVAVEIQELADRIYADAGFGDCRP